MGDKFLLTYPLSSNQASGYLNDRVGKGWAPIERTSTKKKCVCSVKLSSAALLGLPVHKCRQKKADAAADVADERIVHAWPRFLVLLSAS